MGFRAKAFFGLVLVHETRLKASIVHGSNEDGREQHGNALPARYGLLGTLCRQATGYA